ncbi:MAG: 16S rRNA (cytidine(1402)-2'-O)-methyltransferase [Deltaproteobacteria bacterium]|nr:MAG: 16S rRNA (cytidine(1402)-2'-O)-methyltransferase [Deltaproteobacteria bacterium]
MKEDSKPGSLYMVATPIGNLDDITLRAIKTLKNADLIAAEDTRHTRKLLNHLGISNELVSYYREREQQRSEQLIKLIKDGKNIALVSDAGTPAISDPGAVLVQKALREGIRVVPVPGASALTAAVSCSGSEYGSFLFLGFAPVKSGRKKLLQQLKAFEYPLVFYESPKRAASFLNDCLNILGNRRVLWARELTKIHEELRLDRLDKLLEAVQGKEQRGEFVFIIWPGKPEVITEEQITSKILWHQKHNQLKLKDMSREIADELGISKSQVYDLALKIMGKK